MQIALRYLLMLRGLVILGQSLALVTIDRFFDFPVPWMPVSATLIAVITLTILSWGRHRALGFVSNREFALQLLIDIGALSILVYFTGGALNPFISLFLLPAIFAAAALPGLITVLVAGTAVMAYTLLMFVHQPLHHAIDTGQGMNLHLWGMWYGFLLSAGCAAAFVARIGRELREQDAALADAREQGLRNERVVALGTLAAGTAHELGTPLATMAILAHDLSSDLADQPRLQGSLAVLSSQIDRCKQALATLATDAGQLPAQEGYRLSLASFIDNLAAEFRILNAQTDLNVKRSTGTPMIEIVADRTLHQALLNLLQNAAEASVAPVEMDCHWDMNELRIEILDTGSGISHDVQAQLGRTVITSKSGAGLGLGVYLATTAVQRHGGKVEFHPRDGGGTRVSVDLPLASLSTIEP